MQFIAATTTLNSGDVIERYLAHVERAGAVAALVMDLGSEDGTLDLLLSSRWRGFAQLVASPGLEDEDSSNDLLKEAKERFDAMWCLFCDPDEFVPSAIAQWSPQEEVSVFVLPRHNVTAPRSAVNTDGLVPWHDLCLEVCKPVARGPVDFQAMRLAPPWIHSKVGDKIIVRLSRTERIAAGDHSAQVSAGRSEFVPTSVVRHYPMRSYAAFSTKVRTIERFFTINQKLPPEWGTHWRRWVRVMNEGGLWSEFVDQFPDAADASRMLDDGTLRRIAPLSDGN